MTDSKIYGEYKGPYRQKSVKKRIEALFLDNLGKVLDRELIQRAARDPKTKKEPENWHQRLSELRTDEGYTILSWRNRGDLKVQEYLMPNATKRRKAESASGPMTRHGSRFLNGPSIVASGQKAEELAGFMRAKLILWVGVA